jgi:ribosomal protein S1
MPEREVETVNECPFAAINGLLHIPKIADHCHCDPFAVVSVGDIADVTVISADLERDRIDLRWQE